MKVEVVCCNECFARVAYRSTTAATLWVDLCCLMATSENGIVKMTQRDWPQLRTLEQMRFIRTTETSINLLIIVDGIGVTQDGKYTFCLCQEPGGGLDEVH